MAYDYYTDDVRSVWRVDQVTGSAEFFQKGRLAWEAAPGGMPNLKVKIMGGEANLASEEDAARAEAVIRYVRGKLAEDPSLDLCPLEAEGVELYDSGQLDGGAASTTPGA